MKLIVFLALFGCAFAAPAPRTIIDTLGELGQTAILDLIEQVGLTDALNGDGPFTAFVPKQEVLENLPQDILDLITSDPELLAKGLTYHVANGLFLSSDLANEAILPTVEGTGLRVNLYDVDGLTVASVAGVPIDLDNVDIEAGNGVVHLLNYIILDVPDFDTVGTLQNAPAVSDLSFETLLYAAEALGLIDQAGEAADITLLAPVDSDDFTNAVIDELLADPAALLEILLDHLYVGTTYSVGIGLSKEFVSVNGHTVVVTFTPENGYVVNDPEGNLLADIIAGDISTTQGVIHVIDRPILDH